MEIPDMGNIISDFEVGMKCLETPSFFSRLFSFSVVNEGAQMYNIWKWGAVIIALLATFSSITKKLKFLIIRIRKIRPTPESLLQHLDVDLDLSDDEPSSANSSDNEDYAPSTTTFRCRLPVDEDFRVKGSGCYSDERLRNGNPRPRRRVCGDKGCEGFTWADFTTGKNVVKLWDSLGLGFDSFDDLSDSESVVSLWDLNKEQKISNIFGGVGRLSTVSVATKSPAVVLSAKMDDGSKRVVLGTYDTRMGCQSTAAYTEWGRPSVMPAKALKVTSGAVEKVYVRDDGNRIVVVGDARKMKTPLEILTETEDEMCAMLTTLSSTIDCSSS